MDTQKIDELKKKLESNGGDLSPRDKKFALDEINVLVGQLNSDIEEYVLKMKTLEIEQRV